MGHSGRVLGRLRARGHRRKVTARGHGNDVGDGPMGKVTSSTSNCRLDFFRLSSPMLDRIQSRVGGLSMGGLAPLRTLGGLDRVQEVVAKGWGQLLIFV